MRTTLGLVAMLAALQLVTLADVWPAESSLRLELFNYCLYFANAIKAYLFSTFGAKLVWVIHYLMDQSHY